MRCVRRGGGRCKFLPVGSGEFAAAEHSFGQIAAFGFEAGQESGQDSATFEMTFGASIIVNTGLGEKEQVV